MKPAVAICWERKHDYMFSYNYSEIVIGFICRKKKKNNIVKLALDRGGFRRFCTALVFSFYAFYYLQTHLQMCLLLYPQ